MQPGDIVKVKLDDPWATRLFKVVAIKGGLVTIKAQRNARYLTPAGFTMTVLASHIRKATRAEIIKEKNLIVTELKQRAADRKAYDASKNDPIFSGLFDLEN